MDLQLMRSRTGVGFMVILCLVLSCKSAKVIGDGSIDEKLSAKNVIRKHYQNQTNFNTLSGKAKIDYSDGESTQSVNVSLRIQKDKAIWMSAPLGLVKAYITPTRVSFYNKLQNEYFDGDFSYLSELLGTELNFDNVQNLLLGHALFDLRKEKYDVSIARANYQLKPKQALPVFKALFQVEPTNFKIAAQQLSQPSKRRILEIDYKDYQKVSAWILPKRLTVAAIDSAHTNSIDIEYRNMEFNKQLNFPYKIPKGFTEIVLNKNDI
ncbi:DUF4292 domain-containing protein [Ulvibacterium marinum]|uniref:DUF4292 domain-containing protein n=1 Tax=Ulvibacterium marinum TaxID=2419782 RepID=UPI0024941F81|nr:DUF4292 domain-containing protein [Ulvibacterium marinum]